MPAEKQLRIDLARLKTQRVEVGPYGEAIASQEVDVPPDERREPREIRVLDHPALGLELRDHFLHVDRIPVHDAVEQQPERAEFFLLPWRRELPISPRSPKKMRRPRRWRNS